MNDASEVVPYLTTSGIIVYIQRYLKTRDWYRELVTRLPFADKYIQRTVAGLGALIAAVGIHITFAGDYQTGWTFHGSIPDVWTMLHASADFIKVYVLQQVVYDATKDKPIAQQGNSKP